MLWSWWHQFFKCLSWLMVEFRRLRLFDWFSLCRPPPLREYERYSMYSTVLAYAKSFKILGTRFFRKSHARSAPLRKFHLSHQPLLRKFHLSHLINLYFVNFIYLINLHKSGCFNSALDLSENRQIFAAALTFRRNCQRDCLQSRHRLYYSKKSFSVRWFMSISINSSSQESLWRHSYRDIELVDSVSWEAVLSSTEWNDVIFMKGVEFTRSSIYCF